MSEESKKNFALKDENNVGDGGMLTIINLCFYINPHKPHKNSFHAHITS